MFCVGRYRYSVMHHFATFASYSYGLRGQGIFISGIWRCVCECVCVGMLYGYEVGARLAYDVILFGASISRFVCFCFAHFLTV